PSADCSPPRSLHSLGRRRTRASPSYVGRPCDAHSLSARCADVLASALAPLLGPRPTKPRLSLVRAGPALPPQIRGPVPWACVAGLGSLGWLVRAVALPCGAESG